LLSVQSSSPQDWLRHKPVTLSSVRQIAAAKVCPKTMERSVMRIADRLSSLIGDLGTIRAALAATWRKAAISPQFLAQ